MSEIDIENKKISPKTFFFPLCLCIIISFIKLVEIKNGVSFHTLGVYPGNFDKFYGLFLYPLIHSSTNHLFNNLIPLFFLTSALIHFFDRHGYLIFFTIYFFSGLLLFIIGREVYHIGASGIIYGLASFLFFSGIIRNNIQLLSFSLLIVFLYGSMVWGIFPETVKPGVSWEGHLSGSIIGLIFSILLKNIGPQKKKYEWDYEDEDEDEGENEYHYEIVE